MESNWNDSELDKAINQALSGHLDSDVPIGLAARVTRHVSRYRARRKAAFATLLSSAAACILLVVLLTQRPLEPPLQHSRLIAPTRLPVPPLLIPTFAATRHIVRKTCPPKLDVFPSPIPFSREEQSLVSMVRYHPRETALAFKDLQTINDLKVHIEPLRIEPLLETPALGEKE